MKFIIRNANNQVINILDNYTRYSILFLNLNTILNLTKSIRESVR